MSNVLNLSNVTKKYSDFTLDNVSFSVPKGCICGFIGQNGAGKTTTISLILDIIKKDGGTIEVMGQSMEENGVELKESIGVVYDEMGFHEFMTPNEINTMMKHVYKNWQQDVFFDYLKRFSLPRKKRCGAFSRGMRMKLQIAVAMSHKANLLIMDEPTSGLDPIVRTEILELFQEYVTDENNTILFSSHITGDLDRLADEVIFINGGKIILSGNKDELIESHRIIKCKKEEVNQINKEQIISIRSSYVAEEVMVKGDCPGFVADKVTLEDILVFYVLRK